MPVGLSNSIILITFTIKTQCMIITVDDKAGFCPGVKKAIEISEQSLKEGDKVYCLGDIVHNPLEIKRLQQKGIRFVTHNAIHNLNSVTVLIRAHGEPPETYTLLKNNNHRIVDATCHIVKQLQQRIHQAHIEMKDKNGQLVIYGKKMHPEVIGLNGSSGNEAFVFENEDDINILNPDLPVRLFAQTTMNPQLYQQLAQKIKSHMRNQDFVVDMSTCRWMWNRVEKLRFFAREKQLIIFVAGRQSSNGKYLYSICKAENPNTRFVSSTDDLDKRWFKDIDSVGLTGATSTPAWLLNQIVEHIEKP